MVPRLTLGTVLRESLPVAVVVLLWSLVAWFVGALGGDAPVTTGLRFVGLVLGLLYAVGVGYDLADAVSGGVDTRNLPAVLEQSLSVVAPAGVWFAAAWGVELLAGVWTAAGLPGLFTSPVEALALGLAMTGVLTVVVQVVALCVATVRQGGDSRWPVQPVRERFEVGGND